jgi:RimJ/RimL family protein N-acetyltransferase
MIRQAKLDDLDAIFDIRLEASNRLKQMHINQWQSESPTKEKFLEDISKGICFVYEFNGIILGTATFQIEPEYTYQTLTDVTIPAITLHRIAVSNKGLHRGIGHAFFDFMQDHALSLGYHKLYVDTHPDNLIMQKLLHKHDFVLLGTIELEGIPSPTRRVYFKSLTKC